MSVRDILYHPVSGKTNNLLLFIIALIPAFVLFPFPASVFSNGIDPPLAWVFNYLIQGKLSLGKNIIFPHGPLAFLMYPLPISSNLWIAISVHLAARIFLAYSLLKLATRKPPGYMVLALVSACTMLAINDLLLTIVQIIILCYLNFFERRNVLWLIPALVITPVTLYIKAFAGIVSLVVTLSFAGIMVYRTLTGLESRYRLLLFLIVPVIIPFLWILLYGDLNGFSGYLKGMLFLAADNSSAVAVYPINNWWITGIALFSGLVLILINLKNTTLVRYTILVGPALFALWKYGMAREDYLHTSMMFIFILFIVLIYHVLSAKFRIVNILLTAVVVVMFYLTLQKAYFFEPFHIRANGVQNLVIKAFNNKYFADTCNQSSERLIARNKLDKNIRDMIGDQSADIYPWDYSYIAANNLNWQPRPVIQSYASYTRELDELNAMHFQSDKAPEFLIWELRKITHDIHGGALESIDGRYLLNDEPETLITLFSRYELAASQKGTFPVFVYQKRKETLEAKTSIAGRTVARWNTWIDVPANSQDILKAMVELKRNTTGKLLSFFYKDEATYVYFLLANGDIRLYRIVPKNASYGLWINPLILNPELGKNEPLVRKIMFSCSNPGMMKDEINIKWGRVSFSKTDKSPGSKIPVKNPFYAFFGITENIHSVVILASNNSLEEKTLFWSSPGETKIFKTGRNKRLNLLPGDYSVSFEYPLDSLLLENEPNGYIVRTGVWAQAMPGAKAVYVISLEMNGKSLIWKAVDIQAFIHNQHMMNFITNYSILENEFLLQKGLVQKVYALNTGKFPVLLDDFSVRIETR